MPQVQPIKEKFSNLLELASDGNCSLLFDQINQHLASSQVLKLIPAGISVSNLEYSGLSHGEYTRILVSDRVNPDLWHVLIIPFTFLE